MKRIPISQSGQLRLREFEKSFTFTYYMAEPGPKPALLNLKIQAVLIQLGMEF